MKNIILSLFCFSLLFVNCSKKPIEEQSVKNNLQENETKSSKEIGEDLVNKEMPEKEIDEEEQMEAEMLVERTEHKKRMITKNFNFQCLNNCETGGGADATMEVVKKYERREAYDIRQEFKSNLYIIKFKFFDDCCLENVGDIAYVSDTLKIKYVNIGYTPCDCYCEYEYEFKVKLKNKKPKYIKLHDKLL